MDSARIVLSTHNELQKAEKMAQTLVTEKLAACVNIVPSIHSVYRWKEEVVSESEVLLIIKTVARNQEKIAARIRELHPYDVPEFVVIEPASLSPEYLSWIVESTLIDSSQNEGDDDPSVSQ